MAGVEFGALHLAERLQRSRWKSVLVCPDEGDLPDACRRAGVQVQILPRPRIFSTSIRISRGWRFPNPLACAWDVGVILLAARSLAWLLSQLKPDLVVTEGMFPHFYGGLAARWKGVPCVWHAQDFISERWGGIFRRVFARMARSLPTRIVPNAEPIARQLPKCLQDRLHVIYNAVDTAAFRPGRDGTPLRQELGISPDALVIGHVARMTPWKGQHHLLEAFARLAPTTPRALLLLVGSPVFDSDAYERSLRNRAVALGLTERVRFAGQRRDIPQVLAAMDVMAYPSVEKDTCPLALLEAMAAGLPVVAFDIEGVRLVVDDPDCGLLVPVEEIDTLAGAIVRVLTDDSLRRRLALGSRRRVDQAFSLEGHVRHFEEVFLDLLNGGKSNW
jgi:glycosyltransferase involved in cell wall biosynthesis